MLNKRISKDSLKVFAFNFNNTSYKFTEKTVIAIENALNHIKKYKKIYKYIVIYIAICMLPQAFKIGAFLINELMFALANYPIEVVSNNILNGIIDLSKRIIIPFAIFDLVKILVKDAYKEIKCKLNI